MFSQKEPDIYYLPNKFVSINENKAIITDEINESVKIKGIYAVGACNADYKKKAIVKMCDQIIKKLKK